MKLLHRYRSRYIGTCHITSSNLVCRENKERCWTHLSSIRAGAGTGRYPLSLVEEAGRPDERSPVSVKISRAGAGTGRYPFPWSKNTRTVFYNDYSRASRDERTTELTIQMID